MENPTYSNKDCKAPLRRRFAVKSVHVHAAVVLAVGAGLFAMFGSSRTAEATRTLEAAHLTVPLALPDTLSDESAPIPSSVQTVTIKSGDSLSGIFDRVGLGPTVLHAVMQSGPEAGELRRLIPGETLRFDIQAGQLQRLDYDIDPLRTLAVTSNESGYSSSLLIATPEPRMAQVKGAIESSLYAAGQQAGMSDGLIMQMVGIFGWDIDFALDIRQGDRFSVLYQENYVNGRKVGDGEILAAEFVNDGNVFRAVKYTDPTGHSDYYSPDGRSMRKAFLRSPVDFRRISSRFQRERYHPVLGIKRPHQGVDYAASVGTPVKAAGEGRIVFAGTKGGYGKTIIIQHGGTYSTLYGHLSGYAKGTRSGARVRQGQTIGYVGKTGIATGPHLHYEFRVNGAHRNPLTVKLPDAAPIRAEYKANFQMYTSGLLAQLNAFNQVQVASSED